MPDIATSLAKLRSQVPAHVKIVAVSKTMPPGDILAAYSAGQRVFGENRVQEIMAKKDSLPADIEWHMIGHLQSNKVRQLVPLVSMIHSVDSFRLLKSIDSEAAKAGKVIDCLLQVHIAGEETKTGFLVNELMAGIANRETAKLDNVRIRGLMGMATFTNDHAQVRKEFRFLAECFKSLKNRFDEHFNELSMGMSGDFMIAVEEGSTMIRVGSIIFGERKINKT